jgi:hypothetical protein
MVGFFNERISQIHGYEEVNLHLIVEVKSNITIVFPMSPYVSWKPKDQSEQETPATEMIIVIRRF